MGGPNIRPITSHKECWRLDYSGVMSWCGSPGDVKRCPHGKIMVRTQVSIHAHCQGPGTDYWRALSPIFDPILYRRARKALEAAELAAVQAAFDALPKPKDQIPSTVRKAPPPSKPVGRDRW